MDHNAGLSGKIFLECPNCGDNSCNLGMYTFSGFLRAGAGGGGNSGFKNTDHIQWGEKLPEALAAASDLVEQYFCVSSWGVTRVTGKSQKDKKCLACQSPRALLMTEKT